MQAVPYSQYQTYSTYTGDNSLWIQGSTSWTQYAAIPQGAVMSLLATTSSGGSGYLYEITPDGQLTKNYYNFIPGYNQINFYADTVGQHILLFAIGNQIRSAVVIDVSAISHQFIIRNVRSFANDNSAFCYQPPGIKRGADCTGIELDEISPIHRFYASSHFFLFSVCPLMQEYYHKQYTLARNNKLERNRNVR
jgi:hypothetical protein